MKIRLMFVFCALSLTNLTFAMLPHRGIKRKGSLGTLPQNKKPKQMHVTNNESSSFENEKESYIVRELIAQLANNTMTSVASNNNLSAEASVSLKDLTQQMQQMAIILPFTGQKVYFHRNIE